MGKWFKEFTKDLKDIHKYDKLEFEYKELQKRYDIITEKIKEGYFERMIDSIDNGLLSRKESEIKRLRTEIKELKKILKENIK